MKISVNGKEFEAYATSLTGKSFNKDRNDVKLELTTSGSIPFDDIDMIVVNGDIATIVSRANKHVKCKVGKSSLSDFKAFKTVLDLRKFGNEYFCDIFRNPY